LTNRASLLVIGCRLLERSHVSHRRC